MELPENADMAHVPEDQLWENLEISNDFMFAKVMRNKELCRGILERLLEIRIDRIKYPEEQKVINIAKDSKSVRLDVYLKDGKGTVYNIEMQAASSRSLPRRTRYYQGMIDLNAIEKGADYTELPQSLVIFICTFDAFRKEQRKYTFQNVCMEDPDLILNDGAYKIFFNTKGTKGSISKDAENILKYIDSSTAEDDFTEKLAKEVQKVKEHKEWKVEYMTLLMREREKYKEGRAEGILEGRAEGILEGRAGGMIDTLLGIGHVDEDIIAALEKKLGVDHGQAESYLKRYYEGTLF